ncbi:hypothetical protein KIW84_054520 [Lathyrus oleraceus]|uniref:CS domain-containing protein n=1 Tax=Pisum sativum TaxID=3888 RepID=A0A9D4WVJ6_PEA|nr:hypothetical protein KIW84_054520 [Pisum sativum]
MTVPNSELQFSSYGEHKNQAFFSMLSSSLSELRQTPSEQTLLSKLLHDLSSPVKTDSSFWTLEDDIMHITLNKRDKGQTWASPILGQGQLDAYSSDLEQKRLMLQRFQEENPGFDFSQAQFSGNCPDPRTFMGGIRTD